MSDALPCAVDTEAKQATWFVAALSASAGQDLRSTFSFEYGFPIDDAAWPEILGCVQSRIDARPWQPPAEGDLDCDGDIELNDFAAFHDCLQGPGAAVATGCDAADLDSDGDADLRDFSVFQGIFGAP